MLYWLFGYFGFNLTSVPISANKAQPSDYKRNPALHSDLIGGAFNKRFESCKLDLGITLVLGIAAACPLATSVFINREVRNKKKTRINLNNFMLESIRAL